MSCLFRRDLFETDAELSYRDDSFACQIWLDSHLLKRRRSHCSIQNFPRSALFCTFSHFYCHNVVFLVFLSICSIFSGVIVRCSSLPLFASIMNFDIFITWMIASFCASRILELLFADGFCLMLIKVRQWRKQRDASKFNIHPFWVYVCECVSIRITWATKKDLHPLF